MKKSLILFLIICQQGLVALAQTKASISEGPVEAYTKRSQMPRQAFSNGFLFAEESVKLEKGDWLVASAQCKNSVITVLLWDRKAEKFIRAAEDTGLDKFSSKYRSSLIYQIPRSDSFDIRFTVRLPKGIISRHNDADDDYFGASPSSKPDTPTLDYTVAISRASKAQTNVSWDFRKRLSYLCNHWTAGFRAMASKPNPAQKDKEGGKITEYLPDEPVAVIDSMGASLQVLGYGKRLSYFMFTDTLPYARAKAMYDRLQGQLKSATDKTKIKARDANSLWRFNELATTNASLLLPESKVPFEFWNLEDAGKGNKYLPIGLFLYGTKSVARVLMVMGEMSDDIYDIGI